MNDVKKPKHVEGAPAEQSGEQSGEQSKEEVKPVEQKAQAPNQQEKPKEYTPTPQEIAASYEKGDVVIFQDEKGVWQEGVLNSIPKVIFKRDGTPQFKIEIGAENKSFVLNKAPKKAVGPDLLKKIPHRLVELNGKKYRIELFNKTAPISSDGSEEFRLIEYTAGTEKGFYTPELDGAALKNNIKAETKVISAEALKTIIEAEEARKHFDSEVQKLQEQIEKLEGIKTKDVYSKLAKLRKDVERISALTNYNLEEAEDADAKELALINKKIESLQEKIEEDVKSLRRDIKMRGKTQSKEGERKNTKEKETKELKTKQETVKEIEEELKEKLASERWRFERDKRTDVKKYKEELRVWEEKSKKLRDWEAKKRDGKTTEPRPLHPGKKPNPPEQSSDEDREVELLYTILKKRGENDVLTDAVKKELVKRVKKVSGETINPANFDSLEKDALLLIGSNPEQVRKINVDAVEYKKMQDVLEAKENHNKPLDLRIKSLENESQDLQTKKTELDQKIATAEHYRQEDKQTRRELDEKIKEFNALKANEKNAVDKRTELGKERDELQVQYEELDASKDKGKGTEKREKRRQLAELGIRMKVLDDKIEALQNISQTLENLDKEITEKQIKAVATAGALEQVEKNNKQYEAEKKQIDVRLTAIGNELKDVKAQKKVITQSELDELHDKESALDRNKTIVFSSAQKKDAEIYLGEIAKQIFDSWKKDFSETKESAKSENSEAAFNFEEQKKELDDQLANLKTKLTKVPPKARKSLKGKFDDIEKIVDEFEDDTPDIEKHMLAAWKDVTELEVAIDRAIPLHSREAEEVKELKEAKEKRFVVRELPAYVIQELLQSREAELGEVIKIIYEEELNTTKENEVTVIHAKNKVTEAVKKLFSAEAPNKTTLDLLRRYGIRDWKTFKELWDSQYASHVGMMLHEDAQNAIDQDVKEDKMKLRERFFAWARGTPSDAQIRQEAIAVRLGVDLHDTGVVKKKAASLLSRSISTAMREINLELKLSVAQTDEERNEILKSLGRDKSDYTEVNGQFFIKNEEVRMIRESESNDIDKVVPKYAERVDLVIKIRNMLERTSLLLYKQQMDDLTDDEKEQLQKNANFFKDILNQTNSTVEKNKMAVILAHYLTEQDQVKNIVYEYDRLKEMRTSEEFFRAAREVEDLTKKILQKNPDAAKMVEKVVEQAKKTGPNAKSNPLKHAVIAAALAATIAGGMFKMWKPYDIEVRGPIPGSAITQKDSGTQSGGGTTARGIPVNRDSSSQGGSAVASKQENIRSGVTSVEAKPGSVEANRMTTIPIKWNFEKISKFEDVMSKTFSSRMSAGEVLMATSSVKDIISGISDPTDRKTAEKGLYYLIGSIDKDNSASSMERLRTMVNQKDNWQQVAADIIALGKTVDKDSPYLQTEKEKRSEEKMVAEVRALESIYGNKNEFGKKFKGENAYMQWAPLVLKARIKIGPEYLSGANAKPPKERLSALLFDTAGYMARIKKESNGNPADISSANAMGLFQIMRSTVESHCPNQSLADPEVQIACGIAELFKHSNMNDGDPIRTNIGYNAGEGTEKENPKIRGGLRGYQRAAGSTDNDKVLEWLAKGGWYADKEEGSLTEKEINSKKSLQRVPVYVRENIRLTGEFVQNHQWFNELLQRPEFKFLWADLKEDLPEFGLVARNAGVPNT